MGIYCLFRPTKEEEAEKIRQNPDLTASLFYISPEIVRDDVYSIEKAWDNLHLLLTGEYTGIYCDNPGETPLEKAIMGGEEIGEALDYGPPRWLTPSEVVEILNVLSEISEKDLAKRVNDAFLAMTDLSYRNEKDVISYLTWAFTTMRDYYKLAADNAQGMLIMLS
ncbi:MAG TPA: DUF1877 family protein [Desulfobacterales bacterium]|nr:MAG: hypothetical protein DRI57_14510 [Deltaproteobacteria bacterium]HHC24371.1 DUF1877 family protein [Desulfobacterales bacterium]